MPGGIHDVLFRLIGDDDDARQALEATAAELEAFARINAEAEATVDIGEARTRLDELKAKLDELALTTTDVNISADIAGARANVVAFDAELEALDHKDVTIDVEMNRSILDRLQGLTRESNSLGKAFKLAGSEGLSFGQRIAGSAVNIGPFTTQLRVAIPLVAALLGVIVSIIAALAAMAASLVEAAAGLGALAVAFGGVLLPAVGLAIGVIKDFQANADKAGTAANNLKTAISDFGESFDFSGAIHETENALATVLTRARGLGRVLSPAFAAFAHQAAGAIREFGNVVLQPGAIRSFAAVIQQAGGALRPLAQLAGELFRIFTNIANAAMPLLVDGLQSVADAAKGLADQTANIGRLRGIIGVLVGQLQTWLRLMGAISSVFLGFIRAAAGPGQEFVNFLTQGAQALADWVNSAEGQERIKQFFSDTLPLAEQVVTMLARIVVILLQLGELAAPVFVPIFQAINFVLGILIDFLEALRSIPAPIRVIAGDILLGVQAFRLLGGSMEGLLGILSSVGRFILGAAGGIGLLSGAFRVLAAIVGAPLALLTGLAAAIVNLLGFFSPLIGATNQVVGAFHLLAGAGRVAVAAFRAIVGAARSVANFLRGGGLWRGLAAGARAAWSAVRGIVVGALRGILGAVRSGFNAVRAIAREVWNSVRSVIQSALRAATSVVRSAISTMRDVAGTGFRAILSIARAVLSALRSAVSSAFNAAVSAVRSAVGAMRSAASSAFHAVLDTARSVLSGLGGVVSGAFHAAAGAVSAAGGAIVSAAQSIWDRVQSILSAPISLHISVPHVNLPGPLQHGTSFWRGGLALVGEAGPELVELPTGSRVHTAQETAAMGGSVRGGAVEQHFYIVSSPPTGSPDPQVTAAKLALLARQRRDF